MSGIEMDADQEDPEGFQRYVIFGMYGELMLKFQLLEMTLWSFLSRSIKENTTLDQAMLKVEKWDRTTLGSIFRGLKNQDHWPADLVEELSGAVETRNYFAHHFLREFFLAAPLPENFHRGAEKLTEITDRLDALDEALEAHLRTLGVPTAGDLDEETQAIIDALRPTKWPL